MSAVLIVATTVAGALAGAVAGSVIGERVDRSDFGVGALLYAGMGLGVGGLAGVIVGAALFAS